MTHLSDEDRKVQMSDMKSFEDQMPYVGILWYNTEEKKLFGVYKEELTPRRIEEAAEDGLPFINYLQDSFGYSWNVLKMSC